MDSKSRSIVKALSWRFIATVITFTVAYFLTGELKVAAEIGLADTIIKLSAYYFHERSWNKIPLGRLAEPEYEI